MSARREIVKSIRGLYDEKSKAVTMHISKRQRCFRHSFINGSLYWESPHEENADSYFHISVECPVSQKENPPYIVEWGTGYGGIRYCEKCKLIDCIHLWDEAKFVVYQIDNGPYHHDEYYVETCRVCGRRIRTGGCSVNKPSDVGWRIMAEECKRVTGQEFSQDRYGSGFSCELPVHVSDICAASGEDAARDAARRAFRAGDISYLMRREEAK